MTTHVITTAHEQYHKMRFQPGDTVIDPFRMIKPQEGVTVRGLGRNRPELISLLLPTRGRPESFYDMVETARRHATYPRAVEIIAYVDQDDPEYDRYMDMREAVYMICDGRRLLSECWNECYARATGELLMHCGDDVRFRTEGWDEVVRQAFRRYDDRILFAYGDDLGPNGHVFGTHGFVHRRWVEALDYFVPPLFSSDWNDVWLNEVAVNIGRHELLPIVTEHLHYTFGKAERDQTHADREERGVRDDVVNLYKRMKSERDRDVAKLLKVMA